MPGSYVCGLNVMKSGCHDINVVNKRSCLVQDKG